MTQDDEKEHRLLEEAAAKVDQAVQRYLNIPKAPVEHMFDYMYAGLPEHLAEQRAALLAEWQARRARLAG